MTTVVERSTRYGSAALVLEELRGIVGDRLAVGTDVRLQHGTDESWHAPAPPEAVVFAESTEEVAAVVAACARQRVPVVPFGAGTSLEGHVGALHGGVSLDLSRMDRVLEVNVDDLDCLVQAGVHRLALNDVLRRDGLFFPIDPGADATLGGMASTRASGTNAVRYGTMRDSVLGLTVVTADGKVVRTGSRARKSSAGYDLTRLFVGAEGTLGVISEVRLRLYGLPEAISAAGCPFSSLDGAVRATIETIQLGIPVARIELLNEVQVAACNRYSGLDLAERPTLFLEFTGTEASVKEQAEYVAAIAEGHGGESFSWATDQGERERLWKARHNAYYAALAMRPGAKGLPTDVCVPISRLTECIQETQADLDAAGVPAPIVGHVGDGNFHVLYVFDPADAAEVERAQELNRRLVHRAQAMGGTCTGEHGIGYGKLEFMAAEHGDALDVMRAVKAALDPLGIMNPGKVLPAVPPSS
jgi:D-lactate dehydrogenase (cytochrome)